MRSWGLTPRFLLLTLILFLAAGALSFVLFLTSARGIVESLGTRFAITSTRLAKEKVLGIVEPQVVLARTLADSPTLKAWLLDEGNRTKEQAARATLESFRRAFADHSYFVAVSASNTYYNQPVTGERAAVRLNPDRPVDAWFFQTMRTVKDWALNLDYDAHFNVTKVWINCIVHDDGGRPIGLAGSGIDISSFVADLAAEAQEGVSVTLVDDQGNITAHRNLAYLQRNARTLSGSAKLKAIDLAGSPQDRAELQSLLWGVAADPGVVHTARISFEGARSLVAVSALPGLDWDIIASVDLDRILTVRSFALIPLVLLAAMILLLAAMAFLVNRLILTPLGSLTAASREMARGRYDLVLPQSGVGEIAVLASSFSTMADEVRAATANLEDQVRERTRQLADANTRMVEDLEYADLVQRSILPGERALNRRLPDRFILFRPRDMVGGDFYFFRDGEDSFLLGIADCTGHGVAGALMTMYTQSALESIATRMPDGEPADLIRELDAGMRSSLADEETGPGSERGLDIALCRIEPRARKLRFAGAGIDLFAGGPQGVRRIRADRGAIGSRRRRPVGTLSSCELPLDGSTYYLTTDGFLDLGGGPRGFGFGSGRFAALAASCAELDLPAQRERFEASIDQWRGSLAQRDDISVIGFRIGPEGG